MIIDEDIYRDGRWVLRWVDPLLGFVQTRLGGLHNNMTQRGHIGGSAQDVAAYTGVTVAPEWLGHSTGAQAFCDWAVKQPGWGLGWQLDKDLLIPGNREYSPTACCFLPGEVNFAITIKARPKTLVVQAKDGSWTLQYTLGGTKSRQPGFPTEGAALATYKGIRTARVRSLANKYADQLDPRAYAALKSWKPDFGF